MRSLKGTDLKTFNNLVQFILNFDCLLWSVSFSFDDRFFTFYATSKCGTNGKSLNLQRGEEWVKCYSFLGARIKKENRGFLFTIAFEIMPICEPMVD